MLGLAALGFLSVGLVLVAVDDELAAAIELEPTIRPEAKAVIDRLRGRNLDFYIIQNGPGLLSRELMRNRPTGRA